MFSNLFSRKKDKSPKYRVNDVPTIVTGQQASMYNRLKDNIIYFNDNGENKVFQIESSIAGEGKSTVVVNLAASLARNNKKVLVVDLDFRNPKMHKSFKVLNTNGIAEYMINECDIDKLIKHSEFGVDVVNRGKTTQNPSIIFTSKKFKELIEKLRSMYDIILFDCAPILQVSEYMHIIKHADAVIMVVAIDMVKKSQLKDAVELLKVSGANIFGTVMTFEKGKNIPYYNKYYYGKRYGNYDVER